MVYENYDLQTHAVEATGEMSIVTVDWLTRANEKMLHDYQDERLHFTHVQLLHNACPSNAKEQQHLQAPSPTL